MHIDICWDDVTFTGHRDPKTSDEEEYLENLFDTLCTCLMQPSTRTLFFQAEGVQLWTTLHHVEHGPVDPTSQKCRLLKCCSTTKSLEAVASLVMQAWS
jgi:hypothetical protein